MKVAVLGGGHGCYAAAIDMAEKGHRVNLWRRDSSELKHIANNGGLEVTDRLGTRTVPTGDDEGQISLSTELADAVSSAELIVIPLPAFVHEDLARELAPLLKDGQVVYLPPGSFGTYIFASEAKKAGNTAEVAYAETGTLPYLARKSGPASVTISGYATRLPTGVFPARLAESAFEILRQGYPSIEPVEDSLSGALMNAGPIIHPPLILMNAGPLEQFPAWDIHNEGTQTSIRSVTTALDGERIAIREALGYAAPHFPLADHYALDGEEWMYGRGAHEDLTDSGDWREKIDLRTHRYMLEDTKVGLALLVSIGKWAGIPTPVAEGLLSLGKAVTAEDFDTTGRTLGTLGLDDKSPEQMRELLLEGIR